MRRFVPGNTSTCHKEGIPPRVYLWPSSMPPVEASIPGTVRVILILVALWLVLRWLARRFGTRPHNGHAPRPRGDVRVEQVEEASATGGTVEQRAVDAEFEEVK